jgi:KaiC/GvpD/RAD55 family RecA-like ATPase
VLLQFGIPSFDDLIESPQQRQPPDRIVADPDSKPKKPSEKDRKPDPITAESIAILGPDGTGKSVLALHLASRYAADCNRIIAAEAERIAKLTPPGPAVTPPVSAAEGTQCLVPPKILYISSDLRQPSAQKIWTRFALEEPDERHIPFERNREAINRSETAEKTRLKLSEFKPSETAELIEYFTGKKDLKNEVTSTNKPVNGEICFLDLASHTAGDDWNFVNTLLVKLQSIPSAPIGDFPPVEGSRKAIHGKQLPHLVIIDSVEGFETFVGRLDAFGSEQTRRARIAQCVRNAGERVHLVFVVEEPKSSEHLAEEYVTDVVIRLRKRTTLETTSLTVEVQKARSREHANGEHPFEIRDEEGTSTGSWENADTPRANNSYVQVFHSIAHRNRRISFEFGKAEIDRDDRMAGFGLPYLDDLLAEGAGTAAGTFGLRAGSATALIGDPATGKTVLGERFLAQGLEQTARNFTALYLLKLKGREVAEKSAVKEAFDSVFRTLSESIIPKEVVETPENAIKATANIDDTGSSGIADPSSEASSVADKVTAPSAIAAPVIAQDQQEPPAIVDKTPTENWMRELEAAAKKGELETCEILKIIFSDDPKRQQSNTRKSHSRKVWASLKDWKDREKASKLARVDRQGGPKSRTRWTVDWGKIRKWTEDWTKSKKWTVDDLCELFYHPNLRFPGVLLTTQDRRGTEVARRCVNHLLPVMDEIVREVAPELANKQREELLDALRTVIDAQLIVRRFDMQAMPAAAVFQVIQRNVTEANRLIFGLAYPPHQERRNRKASHIRVVIDDLCVLSEVNPEIVADGAFLPFLTFYLQREGVVSLLVHTDSVRPNVPSEDETTRSLLSILKSAILTWNVPFEGRSRVAIGVMPHTDPEKNGIVRELELRGEVPQVTRKFELYSGIEEGKPVSVPLAVYIFNETPPFAAYVAEEDRLFREVFSSVENASPVNPGQVIFPMGSQRYLALRDFTHLSLDAQDGHTMVFQIDEYWALQVPHILDNMNSYLCTPLPRKSDEHVLEDPFSLFVGPPKWKIQSEGSEDGQKYGRIDYFRNSGYVAERPEPDAKTDQNQAGFKKSDMRKFRVPFMWDFGFILARSAPWNMAMNEELFAETERENPNGKEINPIRDEDLNRMIPLKGDSVGLVYQILSGEKKENGDPQEDPSKIKPGRVSWRKFLGACKQVADVHYRQTGAPTVPFDIACPSAETMNALVLEIWQSELEIERRLLAIPASGKAGNSEILVSLLKNSPVAGNVKSIEDAFRQFKDTASNWKEDTNWTIRRDEFRKLPLGAFCLYKTWLLLIEVLQFDEFLDPANPFTFRVGRTASLHAVASRHWYKTACAYSSELYNSEGIHDSVVAMRLPGSYSTRGDWFLGSPKSSRSKLLAQNAIDLLCSRRANLARMQQGLGLPVRDILDDNACKQLRTALRCKMRQSSPDKTRSGERRREEEIELSTEIKYGQLCALGKEDGDTEFHWLWRRHFEDYDRLGRPMQKWLVRLFRWTGDYRMRRSRKWRGGFPGYDLLTRKYLGEVGDYDSFVEFGELCDLLCGELNAAQRINDSGQEPQL